MTRSVVEADSKSLGVNKARLRSAGMTGGVDAPGCLLKFPFVYLVKQSFDPFDESRLWCRMGWP